MNKPKLMRFDQFARITLQRYERYLPTAFDESLTLLEKMNKLIEYLNEMGLLVNDVVDQWNEVMEWIINDGINDVVLDRLDEMLEDGTFERLINETIFEELNDKVDQKADISYVDSEVDTLNTSINQKADTSYVDGEVDTLNTSINQKADISYVDGEFNDINDMMGFKVTKTTENIEYHVSQSGNDNNSGTSSSPFRTIEKAISMIPDVIGENFSFIITIGHGSWNEDIAISNKTVNGSLEVRGLTENNENHSINRCFFSNITGHLTVRNIYARTTTTTAFRFERCTYVLCTNVMAYGDPEADNTSTGYHGLLADYGSNVLVTNSQFDYKRYGIRSNYLSRVYSQNNSGTGNVFGIGARWGGIIQTFSNQPSGSTSRTTDSAGLIFGSRGFMFDKERGEDPYLQEQIKAVHDGRNSKRKYNILNINNSNRSISNNQQLVLTFQLLGYGPVLIEYKYAGTKNDDFPEFIKGVWTGGISGFIRSGNNEVISSTGLSASNVTVSHIGSNQFVMRINPTNAQTASWGVDLEVQMLRMTSAAPRLIDVQIENI